MRILLLAGLFEEQAITLKCLTIAMKLCKSKLNISFFATTGLFKVILK